MKRFADLYERLDATTRTSEKVAALRDYFREAPPEDAAWAMHFLAGRRFKRAVTGRQLREWVADEAALPLWLVEECQSAAGDLSETIALLLPEPPQPVDEPLHEVVETRIKPLSGLDEPARRASVVDTWRAFATRERFIFHKLISGTFRVGVQRKLLVRALAELTGLDAAVLSHRLLSSWAPTPDDYQRLLAPRDDRSDHAQPYPFFLASQLDNSPDTLGHPAEWLAEWKWDGVRAQLIRRAGETIAWSRGEELVADSYPELRAIGEALPGGTVLDGEILAWRENHPLPFNDLQKRIGRRNVEPTLFPETPVIFMAFDILEQHGEDVRTLPVEQRRERLESLRAQLPADLPLRLSHLVEAESWSALNALRAESRQRRVEGLILKRRGSPYRVARQRGDWWKWKIDPFTIDAVLTHAQPGHGRRATLFTDYTFALWDRDELVPIAKAYSGLTDKEIDDVDAFVRRHTRARMGPVRAVQPTLVFELAFEGVQESTRHRAGLSLRFPRMNRWRRDKKPQDADTLEALHRLMRAQ